MESGGRIERGSEEWTWAEQVWEYHHMKHDLPTSADGILVLCSHDLRVADRASSLFLSGHGTWLLFTGGFGTGPHSGANLNGWTKPEAEIFAARAIELGVPAERVLVENAATNTGENIRLSRALLDARSLPYGSLIVVQKPFMERRSYATLVKQWGDGPVPTFAVTSPSVSFAEYPNDHITRETLVSIMVGDLQRIRAYAMPPERDFQIPMDVPDAVWAAYEGLVKAGFDGNTIKGLDL